VTAYTKVNKTQKLAQELLFAFDDIPLSKNYKNDFSTIKLARGMQHYEAPISWARLILEGFSPQSMLGKHNAFSLLFPMEAVFESFVAKYLKQRVKHPLKISVQVQSKSLVSYGENQYFRLKPDLYLSSEMGHKTVLDTKWKLIDQNKTTGKDKFGLSQDDFYQMLGYGYKYLDGDGDLVLIYPKTANFDQPLEHSFNYDQNNKLKLRVLPFDVSHQVDNQGIERIDLQIILEGMN
jgi:5-methylcytosine-specific restriction enzyme subunit McrC